MTSISDAANIVSFFVGAAALAGVIRLLHSQSVDDLRSRLFGLRDEMFLYAVDNGLLTKPAYCELRREMNGFIRYAHKISATQVLVLVLASFYSINRRNASLADWTMHLDDLKDTDKKMLLGFHDRQQSLVATQLIRRSIILRAAMRSLTIYLKITHQIGRRENVVRAMSSHLPWRSLETEAACV